MSEASTVTVLYERKLSDGNYGSEGLSMAVTHSLDHDDLLKLGHLLEQAARDVRRLVLSELARSSAPRVARAAAEELNPRPRVAASALLSEDPEDLPF
jgi:hypothetical protein